MKITLFVLLAMLVGCSTVKEDSSPVAPEETEVKEFMSHEDIVESFKEIQDGPLEVSPEELTAEDLVRKKELIKIDEFFPRKEVRKLDQTVPEVPLMSNPKPEVDLRYRDTSIKRQFNGTCTTFSLVAGMENMINMPNVVNLSERDSWHWYGKYSCSRAVAALEEHKICDEADWPQSKTKAYASCKNNRHAGMIKAKYIGNKTSLALDAMGRGNPVYVGMATPKDMLKCKKIVSPFSGRSSGGHALLIIGYALDSEVEGGGYYVLKNSWGKNCGDQGYQYIPFYYCEKDGNRCRMWELTSVVHGDPSPYTPRRYKCYRKWYKPWTYFKCYKIYLD